MKFELSVAIEDMVYVGGFYEVVVYAFQGYRGLLTILASQSIVFERCRNRGHAWLFVEFL